MKLNEIDFKKNIVLFSNKKFDSKNGIDNIDDYMFVIDCDFKIKRENKTLICECFQHTDYLKYNKIEYIDLNLKNFKAISNFLIKKEDLNNYFYFTIIENNDEFYCYKMAVENIYSDDFFRISCTS